MTAVDRSGLKAGGHAAHDVGHLQGKLARGHGDYGLHLSARLAATPQQVASEGHGLAGAGGSGKHHGVLACFNHALLHGPQAFYVEAATESLGDFVSFHMGVS